MRGRGFVVRRGRSGPVPVRRSGPGLLPGWLVGGRGRIYPAIRRLHRAYKTPPARLAGGPGLLPGGVWRAGFQSPFQSVRQQSPRQPLRRSGPGPGAGGGCLRLWSSVAGRRRGPSPPCCRSGPPAGSAPCPARSCSRAGPPAVPVLRGSVWSAGPGPALAWSWPPARRVPPVPLPVQSGAAISESNRDFSAPYTGPKISSDFSGEVFYARGLSLVSWYINAPL